MWMGGTTPLGYDVRERRLVINQAEAETVRLIYQLYVKLGSVRLVAVDARVNLSNRLTLERRLTRGG